ALTQILSGTGLTYRYLDDKTVTIMPANARAILSSSQERELPKTAGEDSKRHDETSGEGKAGRSFWDRYRVAQVDQGPSASSPTVEKKGEQASEKKPVALEEVVVTAQKREERLIDVPQSVSVL